jgi:hypothetical protein
LKNALADTDKRDDSWQKYNITDCYPCRDAASCSLTGRRSAAALSDKQDVVDPAVPFNYIFYSHSNM